MKTNYQPSINTRNYDRSNWQPILLLTMQRRQSSNLISSVETSFETNITNINCNRIFIDFDAINPIITKYVNHHSKARECIVLYVLPDVNKYLS